MDNDSSDASTAGNAESQSDAQSAENDSQGTGVGNEGNDRVGGWEAQVAEKGFIASRESEPSTSEKAGRSAEMMGIRGVSAEDASEHLSSEFGLFGFVEATQRYGFVEAAIGAAKAAAPNAVAGFVELLANFVVKGVATAIAATNPALAMLALLGGAYGAGKLGDVAHDAALGSTPAGEAFGGMLGSGTDGNDGSGEFVKELFREAGLEDMTLSEFAKLVSDTGIDSQPVRLNRRRSNIIGTGRQGLTIE